MRPQEQFEKETGKKPMEAVEGHGERAFASRDYQLWLESKVKSLVIQSDSKSFCECSFPMIRRDPKTQTGYCFAMIRRDPKTQKAYCLQCEKEIRGSNHG